MDTQGKYRLLVIRSKYLKSTLEESETMFQNAFSEFSESLGSRLDSSPAPEKKKENKQEKKEDKQEENKKEPSPPPVEIKPPTDDGERIEIEKEEKDQNLKQVFRKIALKTHPDKLLSSSEFERKYKEALFEKARDSFEKNDYYGIVQVAEELGIEPPPPTEKQIGLMKERNSILEKKINEIKNSAVWNWYHGDEEVREIVMDKYIEKLKEMRNARA